MTSRDRRDAATRPGAASGRSRTAPGRRGPAGLIARDPDCGVIGGVCQGVAGRTGIDPLLVRMFAALAGLSAGLGIALYLALWITTPTVWDDRTPVERVLPGFRRTGWFGFAILLLATGAGTALAARNLVPLTWWPIVPIALTVVVMRAFRPVLAARARRHRAEAARPSPARSTRPVTVITAITLPLAVAAGLAMFVLVDARPLARVVCGIAATLGTIGIGLVLTSFWTVSRPLRDVGICLGAVILALDTPYITTLGLQAQPSGYHPDQTGQASEFSIDTQSAILDLDSLPAQGNDVTIQVHDSTVHVIAPGTRSVTLDYTCLLSELTLPSADGCAGIGSGTWTSDATAPGAPSRADDAGRSVALHLRVRLVRSQMEVVR